jgi:hypothetical protein
VPVSKSKRSRYTPPPPKNRPKSPLWMPCLMFALLGIGIVVVILDYFSIFGGGQNNWLLLVGLCEIGGGIVVATGIR